MTWFLREHVIFYDVIAECPHSDCNLRGCYARAYNYEVLFPIKSTGTRDMQYVYL